MSKPFSEVTAEPAIREVWDEPSQPNGDGVVLTHGAGANCQSKLLSEMAKALAGCGFIVLRIDLPFRLARSYGPPHPGAAARDREGLRRAAAMMKHKIPGRVFLGGHSYGGRQSTILASEAPGIAEGLLLLSYPLHPPRKPTELRTAHFSKLITPAFFVHGTRDPFGTIAEMQSAVALIPARHQILEVEGVGHELLPKQASNHLVVNIVREFRAFFEARA